MISRVLLASFFVVFLLSPSRCDIYLESNVDDSTTDTAFATDLKKKIKDIYASSPGFSLMSGSPDYIAVIETSLMSDTIEVPCDGNEYNAFIDPHQVHFDGTGDIFSGPFYRRDVETEYEGFTYMETDKQHAVLSYSPSEKSLGKSIVLMCMMRQVEEDTTFQILNLVKVKLGKGFDSSYMFPLADLFVPQAMPQGLPQDMPGMLFSLAQSIPPEKMSEITTTLGPAMDSILKGEIDSSEIIAKYGPLLFEYFQSSPELQGMLGNILGGGLGNLNFQDLLKDGTL